jgi:hypothetical protein
MILKPLHGKAGAGMADSSVDAAGAGVGATVSEATGSFYSCLLVPS